MRAFSAAAALSLFSTAVAHPAPPTETLPSGLIIEHTSGPTTCDRPTRKHDKVLMHYKGTLLDGGKEFDESYKRGRPFQFVLGAHQVIDGWDQGLLDMCIGQSRKLTIPAELGYGSRGAPPSIPPNAVLVFETKLMDIVEFSKEKEATTTTTSLSATLTGASSKLSILPPTATPQPTHSPDSPKGKKPMDDGPPEQAQCHLLGPFALFAQAGLGFLAVLSLVWKRYREVPKRPWKIFFFDVSKQVFGSMLVHVINLAMSMLGSVDVVNAVAAAAEVVAEATDKSGDSRQPNPCSFYVLNLGIDTTLGVPVLYVLLKLLHRLFAYTALANPPQSIKSGNYGQPPKVIWYLKQLLIYCIGLIGMKLFVFFLFMAMPFLPWIGDWALRWTEGSEALQIVFTLFVFPLAMNALQYWIVDGFIMDKKQAEQGHDYQMVDEESGEDDTLMPDEEEVHVTGKDDTAPVLREVDPEPVGSRYADESSSGRAK